MKSIRGYHGEWNMGSPGGWEYQRIAQELGKLAWELVRRNVDVGVEVDFDHPQINAVPGFARMLLRAHRLVHGSNPVHAVLLAETDTLDVVLENRNFVTYLNTLDGVRASLAGPGHLSLANGKVRCRGEEVTVIFMDFNLDTLSKIGQTEDIRAIEEAIRRSILVNPRGMEPLGVKGVFETVTGSQRAHMSPDTLEHTPWTRRFFPRRTTGPQGEPIEDLAAWTEHNWQRLVLKPVRGYSGHGIFCGIQDGDARSAIDTALASGDYIVQELVPVPLWSEETVWPDREREELNLCRWQTDFRCFITDEGLQGFLARFGGIPTNVGSGGGGQPIAVLHEGQDPRAAVDRINEALLKLGFRAFAEIQDEVNRKAVEMGFTYLLGPIKLLLRPRLLSPAHLEDLRVYAAGLWRDAVRLEELWRAGELDEVIHIGEQERELALSQPWRGGPALMVSDGLFSLGADLLQTGTES